MHTHSDAALAAAQISGAENIAVIDAHHHIWDLDANHHPWLRDEPPPAFRYGDSRPLRRNYLPAHYRADAAGFNIVATVYMEAEHDPADPLRETRWVHQIAERDGLPQAMSAAAFFDRDDARDIIFAQAAWPLVRSIRHKPRGVAHPQDYTAGHQIAGSMRCPRWRVGYRHLVESGLHFELQTPGGIWMTPANSPPNFRARSSSSITWDCPPTEARRRYRPGMRRCRDSPRRRTSGSSSQASACRAQDGRQNSTAGSCAKPSACSAQGVACGRAISPLTDWWRATPTS